MSEVQETEPILRGKQKKFADRYLSNGMNATEAAVYAYDYEYDVASSKGSQLLRNVKVSAYLAYHTRKLSMNRDEWLARQHAIAMFDPSPYIKKTEKGKYYLDYELMKEHGYGWLIEKLTENSKGVVNFELLGRQHAMDNIGKALGMNRIDHANADDKPFETKASIEVVASQMSDEELEAEIERFVKRREHFKKATFKSPFSQGR